VVIGINHLETKVRDGEAHNGRNLHSPTTTLCAATRIAALAAGLGEDESSSVNSTHGALFSDGVDDGDTPDTHFHHTS
jgi:hypothetical protein